MKLKACLNGNRTPEEHPALPVTPKQLAEAARDCVQEGVFALHVHPKAANGAESLNGADVAAALTAVRAAVPGIPVGISSGFWILSSGEAQILAARSWTVKPDFVSVNWHEPHAQLLAEELLKLGIGVEAGLWTLETAQAFLKWPHRDRVTRVLLELLAEGDTEAQAMFGVLNSIKAPKLLHGEGAHCWSMLREAARLGLASRIGLEDTLNLPDGTQARDNAELVSAAFQETSRP